MSIDFSKSKSAKAYQCPTVLLVLICPLLVGVLTGCGGSSSDSASSVADATPADASQANPIFTPDAPAGSSDSSPQASASGDAADQPATYGGGESGASYAGESAPQAGRLGAGAGVSNPGEWTPDEGSDPIMFGGADLGPSTPGGPPRGATGPPPGMTGPPSGSFGPPGPGAMGGTGGGPPRGASIGPPGAAGQGAGGGSASVPGGLSMGGPGGFNDGSGGFGMAMGAGGPGFGGAAGTTGTDGFGMVSRFVQQNCVSCHAGFNPKGNLRLDQITADLTAAADLWQSVLFQLESNAMPPATSRQPDPAQKVMVMEFIKESLGTVAEQGYMQQAERAFRQDDLERAMNLFYAHALTADDQEASLALDHIRLYRPKVAKPEDLVASNDFATTIRPRLDTQLTFAVGITLDASSTVTDVKPVGVRQLGGGAGGGLGGAGGPPGLGGAGSDSSKLEAFEDLTGDYGQALLDAYTKRLADGKYGTLFAEVRSGSRQTGQPRQQGGPSGLGFDDGPDDFDAANAGGGGLGLGGAIGGPPVGAGGPPRGVGGPGFGAPGGGGFGASETDSNTLANQELAHGLTYLGVGSRNELLQQAVEMGADGLFLFDIKSSRNPRGIVTTDTRLRFMLSSGKVVATASRNVKNIDVERAIQQNRDADDVEKQIDHIFARLDDILVFETVPQMPDTSAMRHIHGQFHSGAEPLRLLAEARLFHINGIISTEQLATIYQVVLEGNEGISLAEGTEADRKLVLNLMMPDL